MRALHDRTDIIRYEGFGNAVILDNVVRGTRAIVLGQRGESKELPGQRPGSLRTKLGGPVYRQGQPVVVIAHAVSGEFGVD